MGLCDKWNGGGKYMIVKVKLIKPFRKQVFYGVRSLIDNGGTIGLGFFNERPATFFQRDVIRKIKVSK